MYLTRPHVLASSIKEKPFVLSLLLINISEYFQLSKMPRTKRTHCIISVELSLALKKCILSSTMLALIFAIQKCIVTFNITHKIDLIRSPQIHPKPPHPTWSVSKCCGPISTVGDRTCSPKGSERVCLS